LGRGGTIVAGDWSPWVIAGVRQLQSSRNREERFGRSGGFSSLILGPFTNCYYLERENYWKVGSDDFHIRGGRIKASKTQREDGCRQGRVTRGAAFTNPEREKKALSPRG